MTVNAKSTVAALSVSGPHKLREAPPRSTIIAPLLSDERIAAGSGSGPPRLGGGSRLVEEIVANGEAGRGIGASR